MHWSLWSVKRGLLLWTDRWKDPPPTQKLGETGSQKSCVLWPLESLLISTYCSKCGSPTPPLTKRRPILLQSLDGNFLVCCDLLAPSCPDGLWLAEQDNMAWTGLEPRLLGGEKCVPYDGEGGITFNFLHTSPYRKAHVFFNPSIYEYDNENCAYLCTVCVNSVPKCTVNSIFIFFFNLKKKENIRMSWSF